ncbi:BatD family protein [Endozoicomonas sp.]|uniref:BatD family protein n=1 Tax=Endozoicomonas sp. TaxID=1892382 RepID=UPI002888D4E7|nr:BatD family protein [Endozoicomonas sp.]
MLARTTRQNLSHFLAVTLLLIALLMANMANAAFTASVNSTVIASHESLELTLRTDMNSSDAPDLSPLEWSFDLLGTRQQSQTRITNGNREYSREWVISLVPKQQGTLIIPPIKLGAQASEPVTITVRDKKADDSGSDTSPLFMKAEVSSESIYVQQELIFTLQIFFSVQLYDDNRLSALNIDDALMQQLGETRKFDTVINGIRYRGFELKYAIHPQAVGEMVIPSLTFTGVAVEPRDPFGSIFSSGGKPVIARSPEIRVEVKPKPESYPVKETWLPARKLTIQETWSQPLNTLKVGDAITRTITVAADGLSAAQLPPILMPQPKGVNSYPDKSGTEDSETLNGIQGQRTDSIAMIPTHSGTITLPAVEYIWFDTARGEVRVSSLPATTIDVAPDPNAKAQTPPMAVSTPAETEVSKVTGCPEPSIISSEPDNTSIRLWQGLTGLFALLWLVTLGIWRFKSSSGKQADSHEKITGDHHPSNNQVQEAAAFASLESACQQKNVRLTLNELQNWSRLYPGNNKLTSLTDCLNQLGSNELKAACNDLAASLYSAEPKAADIQALLNTVLEECQKIRTKKPEMGSDQELGKLYPR